MRKKWAEGTVLYTRDGAEYKITASNEAGGTAIIYYAEKAGSGIRAVLKEFYPEGWERRKGVPVERAYVDRPDEDQGLLSCYKKLAEQAAREMKISQEVARETVHVWPVRGMLEVQSIREPDGTVWQAEGTLPCCILEMDNLNHKDGLWLQDILREAGKEKSKETPLGNLQPNSKPVLAVPPLQVTLMLVWRLLILLAKIHEAGYLHGDINLGNVFLAMDDKGANVLNAMLIDFGSARALVDGETAPLGKETVMATPGFAAPELADGGERRLTPKADVYAVGKLMHCLLDQNILEALRKGWYSDLKKELKSPTLNASGINDPQLTSAVQKSLDRILSDAAEIKPEKRSSVQEMMEQVMQLYRKIEPPAWQMSLGLLQLNGDEVLGRDKDIKKIEAKLWAEEKLVLHGFSGIGKTKLVTLLGHKWQRNYPCSQVYYAFYPGSMTGLAVDTLARNMSTVAFTEKKDGKDVPRPVAGIIDDMFRELNAHMHENDLLIIDNVDDDTKKFWNSVVHEETVQGQIDLFTRLCQLNCKVLFVTRLDVSNVTGIVPFEVDRLELEPLRTILRENSKDAKGRSDAQKRSDEELDRLIALVDRHTMTVDMIARTMRESRLTVPEIYKELSGDGYGSDAFAEISGQKDTDYSENRIEGHLIRLFRLANFNEREQDMLRYAQLIGENSGMYETLFLACCPHESKDENTKNLEALNHLIRLGYVQQKTEKDSEEVILNLHTLVRVVARKEFCITEEDKEAFYKKVTTNPTFQILLDEEGQSCLQLSDSFRVAAFYTKMGFRWAYWMSYSVRFALQDFTDPSVKDRLVSDVMILVATIKNHPKWFELPERTLLRHYARFYENLYYGIEQFQPEDLTKNISKHTLWLYLVYGLGRTEGCLNSPILSITEYKHWQKIGSSIFFKAIELWEQQERPDRVSLRELYLRVIVPYKKIPEFKEKALDNLKKCPYTDELDYAFFYSKPIVHSYAVAEDDEEYERALQTVSRYEKQYHDQIIARSSKLKKRSKKAWNEIVFYCDELIQKKEYKNAFQLIQLLERISVRKSDEQTLLELKEKYYFETGCFDECLAVCEILRDSCDRDYRIYWIQCIIEIYKRMGKLEKALETILVANEYWRLYSEAVEIAAELYSKIDLNNMLSCPETAEEKAIAYMDLLIESEKKSIKKAQEKADCNQLNRAIQRYKYELLFAVQLRKENSSCMNFLVGEIWWLTKTFSQDKSDWTLRQQDIYCGLYFLYSEKLNTEKKYQEALAAIDEIEAAGLKNLEEIWDQKHRQQTREEILKEMEDTDVKLEGKAKEYYRIACTLLEAEEHSYEMIERYRWYGWNRTSIHVVSAVDGESMLLSAIDIDWKMGHFERASQNARIWMEMQPEDSAGPVRAQAILVGCLCRQKCYVEAKGWLVKIWRDYSKMKKNNESRLDERAYHDVQFWERRISDLEESLSENHPLLAMAHAVLASIYSLKYRLQNRPQNMNMWDENRKITRFEPAKMYLKALKELLFALFHNWASWWEPDT